MPLSSHIFSINLANHLENPSIFLPLALISSTIYLDDSIMFIQTPIFRKKKF